MTGNRFLKYPPHKNVGEMPVAEANLLRFQMISSGVPYMRKVFTNGILEVRKIYGTMFKVNWTPTGDEVPEMLYVLYYRDSGYTYRFKFMNEDKEEVFDIRYSDLNIPSEDSALYWRRENNEYDLGNVVILNRFDRTTYTWNVYVKSKGYTIEDLTHSPNAYLWQWNMWAEEDVFYYINALGVSKVTVLCDEEEVYSFNEETDAFPVGTPAWSTTASKVADMSELEKQVFLTRFVGKGGDMLLVDHKTGDTTLVEGSDSGDYGSPTQRDWVVWIAPDFKIEYNRVDTGTIYIAPYTYKTYDLTVTAYFPWTTVSVELSGNDGEGPDNGVELALLFGWYWPDYFTMAHDINNYIATGTMEGLDVYARDGRSVGSYFDGTTENFLNWDNFGATGVRYWIGGGYGGEDDVADIIIGGDPANPIPPMLTQAEFRALFLYPDDAVSFEGLYQLPGIEKDPDVIDAYNAWKASQ